jgi:hypothetical protein
VTLRAVTQNNSLDPIAIEELAALMARQAWVDMRIVPGGIAERVRVVALLIRREEEEVQFEQWLPDETGEVIRHKHWVHAEEIWWAKPTQFEGRDELTPFRPKGQLQSRDNAFDAAIEAVGQFHRMTGEEVAAISRARLDEKHLRYWVMLVWSDEAHPGRRRPRWHRPAS